MQRDLRKEREIAKAVGPLVMWRAVPTRSIRRTHNRVAATWIRRKEAERRELAAAADLLLGVDQKEFG